jgi:hypothetical protein
LRRFKNIYYSSVIHELLQLSQHVLNLHWIVLKVLCCLNDQHVLGRVGLEPLLVLVVDQSQVFQRNLVLLSSLPLFGSLIALLRSAPEVNNLGLLNLNH